MKKIFVIIFLVLVTPVLAEDIFKTSQENDKTTYTVFLDGDIALPAVYRDIILTLNTAKESDTFVFIINTHGGMADSCFAICNAIKKTKANTIADLYTGYSAGAFIALSCGEIKINPNTTMMLHGMQGGNGEGSISQLFTRADFFNRLNKEVILYFCKNFLTEFEINKLLSGEEIWLTS